MFLRRNLSPLTRWFPTALVFTLLALIGSGCTESDTIAAVDESTTTVTGSDGALQSDTIDAEQLDTGTETETSPPTSAKGGPSSVDETDPEPAAADNPPVSSNSNPTTTSNSDDHESIDQTLPPKPQAPATNNLGSALSKTTEPATNTGIWVPRPGVSWQWQLIDEVDTSIDVEVYDIDLFDTPTETIAKLRGQGQTVICYFSAGAWEDWRPDADEFSPSLVGNSNGWPGEKWLDIRKLDQLKPLMEARLDLAVDKGCDAVEPDNVDGYQNNTGFPLTPSDQIVYNSFLADAAHERGLSIGLKNAVELIGVLEPQFDWALNEECVKYNECAAYKTFVEADKAVFHVEYGGDLSYCEQTRALGFSSIEKDTDVSSDYKACQP